MFELQELLEELEYRVTYGGCFERIFNTPTTFKNYAKHHEFFKAGATHRIRLFTAGNQVGKSTSAAYELTCHLTGIYPDWWEGHRFDRPVSVWIVGKNSELVRQTIQPTLLGQVGSFGTGFIPKDCLDLSTLTDAKKTSTPISSFRVMHRSGGFSNVAFKSGEQGREAFQAATLDIVWCDEEIPFPVFNECQVRLLVKKGLMMYTFTPLKGISDVIKTFSVDGVFKEGSIGNERYIVRCSMEDAAHISPADIETLKASTPPYLRDARIHGYPSLGSGAIYPVPETEYVVDPFPIPKHWKRLYGMDVGNKTASIWIAQNPDTHVWYTFDEYYKERAEPSIHAASIGARGKWIPGAIDPASRGRSQIDGKQLMQMYEDLGLNLSKADNAVEAGLYTVWELLSTDQLKVFRTCTGLLEEVRSYRRDEKGNVVKENDHRVDAWRYAVMTRDIATVEKPVNTNPLAGQFVQPLRF